MSLVRSRHSMIATILATLLFGSPALAVVPPRMRLLSLRRSMRR